MQTDEVLAQLQAWRERHQRPAWRPRVVDGETSVTASKFGGTPWLAPGETWPVCRKCGDFMPFFVQLDLAQLPPALDGRFGTGLLQLFYCTQKSCDADGGWEPFSPSQLVRIVHMPALQQGQLNLAGVGRDLEHNVLWPPIPGSLERFPPKTIVGWEEMIDLPDPEEHEELGLCYTYDFAAKTVRLEWPEVGLTIEGSFGDDLAETVATAASGDKLAGWPVWVQGMEYPSCPRCGRRMWLVFQLDSEDHLPFMFGDMGTGHLTQCPEHLEVVAFGWACS